VRRKLRCFQHNTTTTTEGKRKVNWWRITSISWFSPFSPFTYAFRSALTLFLNRRFFFNYYTHQKKNANDELKCIIIVLCDFIRVFASFMCKKVTVSNMCTTKTIRKWEKLLFFSSMIFMLTFQVNKFLLFR
jgi:hypothetical protein